MCPGETPSDFRGVEASTAGSVPRCAGGVSLQSPSVTAAFRVALVTGTTKSQLPLWEYPAGAGGTSQEDVSAFCPVPHSCPTALGLRPLLERELCTAQPVRAAHQALRLPRGAHPCSVWAKLASGWQCAEGSPGEMQHGFKSGAGAPTSAAHQHLI